MIMVHSGASASIPTEQAAHPALNGPDLWNRILADMPRGSIIAGGAIRDYLLSVPPKDIDVFCWSAALGSFDFTGFEPLGSDRADEYAAMSIIDIVQRTSRYGIQVDLVGIGIPEWSPEAMVQTFDFGITRCWFDGERIHTTPEADHDLENSVVTLLLKDRPERAAVRFARFNENHGGRFTMEQSA